MPTICWCSQLTLLLNLTCFGKIHHCPADSQSLLILVLRLFSRAVWINRNSCRPCCHWLWTGPCNAEPVEEVQISAAIKQIQTKTTLALQGKDNGRYLILCLIHNEGPTRSTNSCLASLGVWNNIIKSLGLGVLDSKLSELYIQNLYTQVTQIYLGTYLSNFIEFWETAFFGLC